MAVLVVLGLAACQQQATAPTETADQFVERLNKDFAALHVEGAQAGWVQATYITPDTEAINARTNDRFLAYFNAAVEQARQFDGQPMSPASARAIALLRQGVSSPAPTDPALRAELTQLDARLEAAYGQAKFCVAGTTGCEGVDVLGERLGATRDYAEAEKLWTGWHDQGAQMRKDYERFVELANQGARELGYADMGAMWRSGYDMSPEEFTAVTEKLWNQVKPLYEAMHCYTRTQLAKQYGADKVKPGEPIPAHLLGNMWGQQWNKIYDDLLQPYPSVKVESADRALKEQKWDAIRMTRSAESFYTSLGFQPLPGTFWERSMLTRPRDRDVVCHASAWTIDTKEDVRIKMCMQPNEEELFTIYHELGHLYYDLSYNKLPYMFQGGAHDGFHEAIGDTVNLSVTPGYLAGIGLARAVKPSNEAVINTQMKMAADKIAFLPFGKVIDEWRWKVFSGEIRPADYNRTWWEMRRRYQGIAPATPRDESQFDPAAKYHVAANVPYTRYFLSYILQFQFHKALCDAAGFKGPLHECSIAGNREAGARLKAMLEAGQGEPWPVTLEKLTGTREMDASAIIEYFEPLLAWLAEKNRGQQCGWS
ncbi:MAG: M2 family metallopeptidase [Steroidobacteraceae bacterium]